ncbi:hypothetical protein ACKKBF_B35550 [Auxenochlorella protothecoides x Auxenochlorella symbiontica]
MGRRRGKKGENAGENADEADTKTAADVQGDPLRALIAISPTSGSVAVAAGPELRVLARSAAGAYDSSVRVLHAQQPQPGPSAIRTLAFDGSGEFLLASTDAKVLYVWRTATWELQNTIKLPKRATSMAFTADNQHWLLSDKYGDVLVAPLASKQSDLVPEVLLGHCSSILTSISVPHDGALIASADRDQKVRVSRLPAGAGVMDGAPHIQSFCLGHTDAVTAVAFITHEGSTLLVSGSADGTLKLWDPSLGDLLDSLSLPAAGVAGAGTTPGTDDAGAATELGAGAASAGAPTDAVLGLVPLPGTNQVAVLVDARHAVLLASVDFGAHALSWRGAALDLAPLQPTDAAVDGAGRLWLAAGPSGGAGTGAALALAESGGRGLERVGLVGVEGLGVAAWSEMQGDVGGGPGKPRRLLAHLAKVPPSEEDVNFRKRQRRDLRGG